MNEMSAWYGPAFLPHPWWQDRPFMTAFKFEGRTEADAVRQATEAYNHLRLRAVTVEVAGGEKEMHDASASFIAGNSNVLKICRLIR